MPTLPAEIMVVLQHFSPVVSAADSTANDGGLSSLNYQQCVINYRQVSASWQMDIASREQRVAISLGENLTRQIPRNKNHYCSGTLKPFNLARMNLLESVFETF